MILTDSEILHARALLAAGFSWSYVRAHFAGRFKDHHTFRAEIEPQYREQRTAQRRARNQNGPARVREPFGATGHKVLSDGSVPSRIIPEVVLRERAERMAALEARTATQKFFGDPPPGFSALDQRAKG